MTCRRHVAVFQTGTARAAGLMLGTTLLLLLLLTSTANANRVFAWGRNYYGQTDVPPNLTNAIAVSAGYQHCVALTDTGNVVAWGQNTNNQLNIPISISNRVRAVAAGWYHSIALLDDGSVVGWGAGLTNTGVGHEFGQCITPANVTNVLSIAAGRYFSMALLSDHSVAVWGENFYGQTNIPAAVTNVVAIAAGGMHCMALTQDGKVIAWGGNGSGESAVPGNLSNVVAIAAGYYNSYALKSDGSISIWGDNTEQQDMLPAGVSNIVMATGGAYYSMVVEDNGTPVAWDYDSFLNKVLDDAIVPAGMTNVTSIAAGFYMGVAVTNDGSPTITGQPLNRSAFSGTDVEFRALVTGIAPMSYQWSSNGVPIPDATNAALHLSSVTLSHQAAYSYVASNSLGSVSSSNAVLTVIQQSPILLTQPVSVTSYRFRSATFSSSAIGSLPLSFQWQLNGTNIPDATNATLSITRALPSQGGNYSVVVSNEFGSVISTNATLYLLQVLDNGTGTYGSGPATPLSLTNDVQAVAAGALHSLALKRDGTLIAWGNNISHQTNIPPSATNVIAIAAGGNCSLALRSNGTVVEWGDGYSGQTNVPVTATNVMAIAAGEQHSLALRSNGTVVAWGNNVYGETNVPASATNIIAIAVGSYHSVALRSNGTVVAWGYNSYGQTNIPAAVTNVAAIAAAGNHNYIVRRDGSVYSWGDMSGSLGSLNAVALACGVYSSSSYALILRGDGTTTGGYASGVSNAVAIAGGGSHHLILLGDGSPYLYGPPSQLPNAKTGDTVSTKINVSGVGPIYYQWQFNGADIVGATNATLTLTNIPITYAGAYRCIISNALGTVTSAEVPLSISRLPLTFSTGTNAMALSATGFQFRVNGSSGGAPLIVYGSSNLVDWAPILTNGPAAGTINFTDSDATNRPQTFYKVVEGQ